MINFTLFLPKSGVVLTLAVGLAVKICFVTEFTEFLIFFVYYFFITMFRGKLFCSKKHLPCA